ncbi:NAD-dependent epimerase/dehydratase family protein [Desulfoferrobacter suflitae]|uniref:NAD-dependent epimerase/dehydratase family protein n=1 Tax=Desulfoferrobacter suflitae TaxID=2865782 RepID=UPI00216412B9|nr:NAD-dependent epimerase/dehydratase family protein [Desulfoferrobacter suflitae]MCK8604365.1 NAD-dependent epimerase/dehydratase family protein [Desulfoferrobacter suflitae]
MRVLVLGGDGYLGWPTAMHLSARGHEVAVVDNYLRRRLCRELDVEPLFEVPNLHDRVRLWEAISGHKVNLLIGDLIEWEFVVEVFSKFKPDAIIHYAEQPSAPYSMLNRRAATLTLQNNLLVTANVIFAVREFAPSAHIIKLGTMGEYGTPNIDIEEGWIDIQHKGRRERFLYPRQAGSLYHTTKIMDTDLLWFYVRMWNLAVTDLMQGPVYGLITEESTEDSRLLPFFNYDEIFGTVLNRFIVQAVAGYPLTVYGRGGQTRGYLNIKDTLSCVRLSLENPARKGELRIFNQFVETFSVKELAERVLKVGNSLGLGVRIQSVENPRKEAEEHYYNPEHTGLLEIGLKPHYLTDEIIAEMLEKVRLHQNAVQLHRICREVKWG